MSITSLITHGVGGAGRVSNPQLKTADFTAVNRGVYAVDTRLLAIVAQLPANPNNGWRVEFIDYAGSFDTYSLFVQPNGSLIFGLAESYQLNQKRIGRVFTYQDNIQGWLVR